MSIILKIDYVLFGLCNITQRTSELVVCLLMTRENIRKAEDLIRDWFAGRDNIVNERIERIYEDQERMDGE